MESAIVVALKAIILFKERALIIQRSGDDDIGANTWEFAGGKLNFGEDLVEALKREIKEEVSLDVDVDKLLYATTFKTDKHRQVVILAYLCAAYNDDVTLSSEHKNYIWADRKQMLELLSEPIIKDLESNCIWEQLNLTDSV